MSSEYFAHLAVEIADEGAADLRAGRVAALWIEYERRRQDAKWGEQNHGADTWLAILMEEVGELAKAHLERDPGAFLAEAVQVAAVAKALLECIFRKADAANRLDWTP